MKVENKVVIVTGGGNGIGRELVLNLLARGARIAAVDISAPALEETVGLAGSRKDRLTTHVVDITDRAAVAALPEPVISSHGTVDGLINNAGIIQPFVKVNELGYDAIERVMNVNFYGALAITKAFLPHLLARSEAHIVNISSMGAFLPVPGQTIYGASKAAVKLFTEGLRSELLDTNVRVTVVFPGATSTDIAGRSGVGDSLNIDMEHSPIKMLSPAKAAQIIVTGMEKNRYRVLVGMDARLMDLLCRISPKGAARLIYSQMKVLLSD